MWNCVKNTGMLCHGHLDEGLYFLVSSLWYGCVSGPLLLSLLGRGENGVKPLDCVGTPAEVQLALRMARDRSVLHQLCLV